LKAIGIGELTSLQNGATKAKRRFLQQLGWTVVNLDFRDYNAAQTQEKKKKWLQQELLTAGIELVGE